MIRQRLREGARAGAVAAAATAGALIAFGRAHGATFRPLNSVAHIVVGSRAYFMEGLGPITILALAVHIAAVVAWGIALALMTTTLRGGALYAASVAFAAVTWIIDFQLVPERLKPGFDLGLTAAEVAFLYLVLGVSLAWALDRERNKT